MEALIASPSFFLPISNSYLHNRFFSSPSSPNIKLGTFRKNHLSFSSHLVYSSSPVSAPSSFTTLSRNTYWMVILDRPPQRVSSKSDIVDYYVEILAKVLRKWVPFLLLLILPFVSFWVLCFAYLLCCLQPKGCADEYIWCFLWYPFRVLLSYRRRCFTPSR